MNTVDARVDLEKILWRIASCGLRDNGDVISALGLEQQDWDRLLRMLSYNRATGFALAGSQTGELDLSADQEAALLEAHREAMLGPLAVERGLIELSSVLQEDGVEFVVLKGPALAHTVYPDPSWRFFGDLDLLVRGRDWARVSGLLESMGYRRRLPEPRAGFDRRFGKASEFRRDGGIEVDLHRTLVVGPFGLWIEPEALLDRAVDLELWGQKLRRLDDTLLQLHACIHASLGWSPPLLVPVRDVLQVAQDGQVDWDGLADFATRWKLRAVVRDALRTAARMLGVDPPPGARRAVATAASQLEWRALLSYQAGRRSRGGTEISTLRAIRGLRGKAAYLRALIFPDREFLAARFGQRSYLKRWAVPMRWLLARLRKAARP